MEDENQLTKDRLSNLANNFVKTQTVKIDEITTGNLTVEIHIQDRGGGRECYYAVINGEPAAYCYGNVQKRRTGKRFVIASTFVHPQYQRKGVGTALYTSIINSNVMLVSDWDLSPGAISLWEKLLKSLPFKTVVVVRDGYFARKRP